MTRSQVRPQQPARRTARIEARNPTQKLMGAIIDGKLMVPTSERLVPQSVMEDVAFAKRRDKRRARNKAAKASRRKNRR